MPLVLVIDDEPNLVYSLEKALGTADLRVEGAFTARRGIEMVRERAPDAVLLDLRLPDMPGLEAFGQITRIDARLPVVVVTAHGTTDTAIEAMKLGAFDYLLKPLDVPHLREVIDRAVRLNRIRHTPVVFDQGAGGEPAGRIVGRSPAMQEVYKAVGRFAAQDVSVLVTGESGTGKELVACAIYQHSRRRDQPFLAINCAAVSEAVLEGELFGHETGAIPGADRQRIGKFEQAHGGTLFLDEVGDMAPATQAKLLRLLQDQRFERVGGSQTIQADVRIIAATNKDLERLCDEGRFRQDLLYRLNALTIHLPPLRERLDDLPHLVNHFLHLLGREFRKPARSVTPEYLNLLRRHRWPGNIRELQNVVRFSLIHSAGDVLTADHLPKALRGGSALAAGRPAAHARLRAELRQVINDLLHDGELDLYRKVLYLVDEAVLAEVLTHTDGNQVVASELLGISRTTLRAKLRANEAGRPKGGRAEGERD